MISYAPIILFAYKRADKLKECLEALEKNIGVENHVIYIMCDGPKKEDDVLKVKEVRNFIHEYKKRSIFKEMHIVESDINKGLARSIISGVTEIIEKYGRIIVLEDDIITTMDFLQYMNGALEFYEELKQYGSISAFTQPLKGLEEYDKDIYATRKGECWGWGTWKDRWESVDWSVGDYQEFLTNSEKRRAFSKVQYGIDKMLIAQMEGKIDSWAVRWCYHLFKNQLLSVYPKMSKTQNIGFDGSGTHCDQELKMYKNELKQEVHKCRFEVVDLNVKLEKEAAIFEKIPVWERMLLVAKKIIKNIGIEK